jgi:hypothetical protein
VCVALALRQRALALRSLRALVIGFPVAIGVTLVATLLGRAVAWSTRRCLTPPTR